MRANKLVMILLLLGVTFLFLGESVNAEDPEYRDGDAFYNPCGLEWQSESCSVTAPDWKFGFDQLTSDHPEIYIKNDFVVNDDTDNPITVGECYDFPCGEYKLCFDGLNTENYADYTIEFKTKVDLSDANPVYTSEPTFHIHTSSSPLVSLQLESDNITGLTSDVNTEEVWLHIDKITPINLGVYYRDDDGKVALAGYISTIGGFKDLNFARIMFGETKGVNVELDLTKQISNNDAMYLEFDVMDDDTNIEEGIDNLVITLGQSETKFESLGYIPNKAEASELIYGAHNDGIVDIEIGTKDEDHMTAYGIIIENPAENGKSDKVRLQIPADAVEAQVSLRNKNNKILEQGSINLGNAIGDNTKQDYLDEYSTLTERVRFSDESPTIETSLTGSDDDYGTGIYMEVGKGGIEYSYFNNAELNVGDTIKFLEDYITLTYIADRSVSLTGEHICKEEVSGCVRDDNYDKVGCHAFDAKYGGTSRICRLVNGINSNDGYNAVYTQRNGESYTAKGWPQACKWGNDNGGNCYATGSPIPCEDERLQNEDMCTTQIGCKWVDSSSWSTGKHSFICEGTGCYFIQGLYTGLDVVLTPVFEDASLSFPEESYETVATLTVNKENGRTEIKIHLDDPTTGTFAPPSTLGMTGGTVGVALLIFAVIGIASYYYKDNIREFRRRARRRRR